MQIGGLKTILVKEGHEQEFEGLFGELRAAMGHSEPDCLYYSLLKSRTNPRHFGKYRSGILRRDCSVTGASGYTVSSP